MSHPELIWKLPTYDCRKWPYINVCATCNMAYQATVNPSERESSVRDTMQFTAKKIALVTSIIIISLPYQRWPCVVCLISPRQFCQWLSKYGHIRAQLMLHTSLSHSIKSDNDTTPLSSEVLWRNGWLANWKWITTLGFSSSTDKEKGKPRHNNRHKGYIKYDTKAPNTTQQTILQNKEYGNRAWQEATPRKINAMNEQDCLEFKASGCISNKDSQEALLWMIYDLNNEGTKEAHLVAGCHKADVGHLVTHATVAKHVSIWLVVIISHHQGLETLPVDVNNTTYILQGKGLGKRQTGI